jgi:hypothetical protein
MKSNLHGLFATDKRLEKEGKKIPVGNGVYFYIRRFGGSNAARLKEAMAKHYAPYSAQIKDGIALAEEVEAELSAKIFVETCVSGWEGVKDEQDNLIEFSIPAAIALLKDLPELVEMLMTQANDYKTYRQELGNS